MLFLICYIYKRLVTFNILHIFFAAVITIRPGILVRQHIVKIQSVGLFVHVAVASERLNLCFTSLEMYVNEETRLN
jgi:hypothetical protein